MFGNLLRRKIGDVNALFAGHFVEVKAFYSWKFRRIPCVTFVGELDMTKAFAYLSEKHKCDVAVVYQHSYFDYVEKTMLFNYTILVLTKNRMIEVANNYCQILHSVHQYEWAHELAKELADFRVVPEPVKENRIIGFARQTGMN